MCAYSSFGGSELLQIADAVAREKGISKESVLVAMEQAIQIAGRRKYGHEHEIRAEIDHKTGQVNLYRVMTVVENVENPAIEISLASAHRTNKEAQLGDQLTDQLPPIDFGRIAAQTAKQVIIQKVRDAEREKQFEEFKDRSGEIINGIVKRAEYGSVIVELGKTEAVMRREDSIPREMFRPGDRIRAYMKAVSREKSGPQIFLSRAHPMFLAKLFAQEVPEIYDGVIEIKAVARDPGSRAKICVASRDPGVDPVGSCVGIRGSRVQAVTNELQGEKIDIIQWSPDPAVLVVNALSPADIAKVVIDETRGRLEVVVPDDQLSLAIGRRGQNVKLASQLVGWEIDVMTEDEESKKRADEFNRVSQLFIEALNVEDVIAHLLVSEGFSAIEEIAYADVAELAGIEGFDESIAEEIIRRGAQYLEQKQEEMRTKLKSLKVKKELMAVEGLTLEMLVQLAEKGEIKTLDDFADLSRDEFFELVPDSGLSNEQVDAMIMAARAHWFEDEDADRKAG